MLREAAFPIGVGIEGRCWVGAGEASAMLIKVNFRTSCSAIWRAVDRTIWTIESDGESDGESQPKMERLSTQVGSHHRLGISADGLPQQAQALDDGRLFGALTASGKSSSEGLREIFRFWVGHRFV